MKPTWKKLIPRSLVFLLVASSPLNVLSTTAYANTLDKSSVNTEVTETGVPTIDSVTPSEELIHLPGNEEPTGSEPSSPENPIVPPEQNVPIENPVTETPVETPTVPSVPPADEEPLEPSEPVEETPVEEEPVEETVPEIEAPEEEEVLPITDEERFKLAKETMESAENYAGKRKLVNDAVALFKKDQTKDNLQLVLDYTVLLPYNNDSLYKKDKQHFATLAESLFEFVENKNEKNTLAYHFAQHAIAQTYLTLNHNDLGIARVAHNLLPDGDKKKANAIELKKVSDKVYAEHSDPDSGYINWDDPEIDFGDVTDGGGDNWEPGFDPDGHFDDSPNGDSGGSGGSDNFQEGFSLINFKFEGNACYKQTIQFKADGTMIKQTKELATDAEKAFCVSEVPPSNAKEHFGADWVKITVEGVTGVPDSLSGDNAKDNVKVDKIDKKVVTLHYTFDKDSDSPYYQDTGIEVSEDQTITYQQARDALYQITIADRSKFVEDVGKSLGLLDGHIILVENPKKPIPIKEFIALFDETMVGIKAQATRSGDTYELIDLIEIKGLKNVYIDGEIFAFASPPIIDDEAVLFPVEQFATELGAEVTTEKEQTIVNWKNNAILFKDGSSTVTNGNGEVVELASATRLTKDGIRMVDINALLTLLDAKIEIDAFNDDVVITTK